MANRKFGDAGGLATDQVASQQQYRARRFSYYSIQGCIEILWGTEFQRLKLHPDHESPALHFLPGQIGSARGPEDSDTRRARKNLLEQFQPLAGEVRAEERQPRDIATRPGQARDEAGADWILHRRRYNRD